VDFSGEGLKAMEGEGGDVRILDDRECYYVGMGGEYVCYYVPADGVDSVTAADSADAEYVEISVASGTSDIAAATGAADASAVSAVAATSAADAPAAGNIAAIGAAVGEGEKSYGEIMRVKPDGTGRAVIANAPGNVSSMFTASDKVYFTVSEPQGSAGVYSVPINAGGASGAGNSSDAENTTNAENVGIAGDVS
jgi:hypothetical protein